MCRLLYFWLLFSRRRLSLRQICDKCLSPDFGSSIQFFNKVVNVIEIPVVGFYVWVFFIILIFVTALIFLALVFEETSEFATNL